MSQSDVSTQNFAVWFEIPTLDFQRAIAFYQDIFQCQLHQKDMGPMRLAVFPYAGKAVSGALVSGAGMTPSADGCVVYLNAGPDLSVVLGRAQSQGCTVLVGKTKISDDIGYFAQFIDCEGNRIGIHSLH